MTAPGHAGAAHAAHWAYDGDAGPAVRGGLEPEFQLCAPGRRQSPIDIFSRLCPMNARSLQSASGLLIERLN